MAHVTLGHTAQQLSGQFHALAAEIAADAAAQRTLQRLGLHPQAGVELLLRLRRDDALAAEQALLSERLRALMPLVPQVCLLHSGSDQVRFDAVLAPYRN